MGPDGLLAATEHAILAANYVATRLQEHFPVLYTGADGLVAHECILDIRPLTKATGVTNDDIAKRLIDFGFHAPTMSFPVAGTLMVEPTESEDKAELDRFVEAMVDDPRARSRRSPRGEYDRTDNPLRNAPHTLAMLAGEWERPYPRTHGGLPGDGPGRAAVPQPGPPDRPGLRRPQPGLRLPAARGVRRARLHGARGAGNGSVPARARRRTGRPGDDGRRGGRAGLTLAGPSRPARSGRVPAMTDAGAKADLRGDLQAGRDALLWKLEGLSEYDVRRPMTPTGTNLLGPGEAPGLRRDGLLRRRFGRPVEEARPWIDDEGEPNWDMWATADGVARAGRRAVPPGVGRTRRDDRPPAPGGPRPGVVVAARDGRR